MNVTICIGSSCHIKGSREIVETFQKLVQKYELGDKVQLGGTFCMCNCEKGVCVTVDGKLYSVSPEEAEQFFENTIKKEA